MHSITAAAVASSPAAVAASCTRACAASLARDARTSRRKARTRGTPQWAVSAAVQGYINYRPAGSVLVEYTIYRVVLGRSDARNTT
jgi:hypothetical protein